MPLVKLLWRLGRCALVIPKRAADAGLTVRPRNSYLDQATMTIRQEWPQAKTTRPEKSTDESERDGESAAAPAAPVIDAPVIDRKRQAHGGHPRPQNRVGEETQAETWASTQ